MDLQLFDVSGSNIRFGMTEDDVPYAVASDFAQTMGYRDAANATRLLDSDEYGYQVVDLGSTHETSTPERRRMTVIFEDGMWELIFRSTLPGAKAIKARVKQILKEIRETGAYIPNGQVPPVPPSTDIQGLRQLHVAYGQVLEAYDRVDTARALAEAQKRALVAKNRELGVRMELDAPKVEAYEKFHNASNYKMLEIFAKEMNISGVGRNNFVDVLRELKIFQPGTTVPYQEYFEGNPPMFFLKPSGYEDNATKEWIATEVTMIHPSVMPKIEKKIRDLMEREGMKRYVKQETRRKHKEQEAIRNSANVLPMKWRRTDSGAYFPEVGTS